VVPGVAPLIADLIYRSLNTLSEKFRLSWVHQGKLGKLEKSYSMPSSSSPMSDMLDTISTLGMQAPTSAGIALARPKISILASDLSQQGAGRWGGGVRPFLLSQALQKAGYPVDIVGFTTDETPPHFSDNFCVRAIPVPSPNLNFTSIRHLLGDLQGDIIYAYKLKPSSFGLALLHRLGHRRPVVLDIDDWEMSWHGGDDWRYRATPKQLARDLLKPQGALRNPDHPLYLRWLEHWTGWANVITTHNAFLQKRFGGIYVPNGKDTERFNPALYDAEACRTAYGLEHYRVLMFPGAPRPYKGVEDVLQALDLIGEDDLKLVIVGGSPYDDYDRHLLERWPQHIVHLGKHPQADMPKLVAAAHIVVVPQRQTPAAQAQFPLKLTDGMAMAKPILATRVGDMTTILGDTGYLVDADAPDQLATQIRHIFSQYSDALRLGQAARERCVKHYSIDTMANSLDKLFLRLSSLS
jgi:glycosyltransferase involved in cell wall biosynthesis